MDARWHLGHRHVPPGRYAERRSVTMEGGHLDSLKAVIENMQSYADMVQREDEAAKAAEAEQTTAQLNELGAMTEAAYLIAVADDELSETEANKITSGISHLTSGRFNEDQVAGLVGQAA